MKKILKQLSVVFFLFFAGIVSANAKIGVINIELLMQDSPQSKVFRAKLEEEFKDRKNELYATEKKFRTAIEQLNRDKDVLSEGEKRKKEKNIEKLQRELQRQDQELQADSSQRGKEEMDQFLKVFNKVLQEVAKSEKYDLIVSKEITLFNTNTIDITQKVLKKLQMVEKTAS